MATASNKPHHQYYYSNYNTYFTTEVYDARGSEETSQMYHNNNINPEIFNTVPSMGTYETNSPASVVSLSEQFGVPDCMDVPALAEYDRFGTTFLDFAACNYRKRQDQVYYEPAGEAYYYNSLVPNMIWPANYPMADEISGMQDGLVTKVEELEMKVRRYSAEERKDRILRYLKKRNQRNFKKTIKYACRKTLADKRLRVHGRFAKNNEPCCEHDEMVSPNSSTLSWQMKYDDDEDLWEAVVASLM